MITKEEVEALRKAIPARMPRGHPGNLGRMATGARFSAALRRYKKEHGRSWFDDMEGGNK